VTLCVIFYLQNDQGLAIQSPNETTLQPAVGYDRECNSHSSRAAAPQRIL